MSDQEAMAAMAAQQSANAAGPATNMQVPASYPTGMSMPANPVGYAGTPDAGNWYDNLFKGGGWDPKNFDQSKLKAFGSIGNLIQMKQPQQGMLAQPMMGGGGYRPQQQQSTMPALALIHPSTRIY